MDNRNGILKETVRQSGFTVLAGVVLRMNFSDKHTPDKVPNTFQIRNAGTQTLYIALFDNVSNTNYEIAIPATGGTRVYVAPGGTYTLCAYSAADAPIIVNSMYAETVQAYDLDETLATTIINSVIASTVGITGALPAGTNNIGDVDIVSLPNPGTPTIYNVAIPAGVWQEASQGISGAKKISVSLQGGTSSQKMRVAFAAGKVTGTPPYLEYPADGEYSEDGINFTGTVFVSCDTTGKTAQIKVWS